MLEKNILDRIVKFFKSIGTKEASGEPIDLGRHRHDSDSEEKQIRIHHDVEIKSEAPAAASEPMIKVVHEDNEKSEPQKEQTHNAVVVAKVHPRREYSQALEILRNRYPWRKLKAEKALSVQDLPEPFYFLTSDNQPVEASKFEVSFVKELLAKAAEAGIENKFSYIFPYHIYWLCSCCYYWWRSCKCRKYNTSKHNNRSFKTYSYITF